jgi:catechol 2,3-dioxygenase-like lactoylglutathione lyase family enzyme
MKPLLFLMTCALVLATGFASPGRDQITMPAAHFHHLHLNTPDPKAAIDFYTSKFDCERGRFAGGMDAVWAQKSWLLFTKVSSPPPWELTSAIWHFGWGAEDMKATYQRQLDMKTKFFTPITELGANFFYAYVETPDHGLIELNTANHHNFGHLHLPADPVWRESGVITLAQPNSAFTRAVRNDQGRPETCVMLDNEHNHLSVQYRDGSTPITGRKTEMSPTKAGGRPRRLQLDNLAAALEKMRKDSVVTDEIKSALGGKIKLHIRPDKIPHRAG